VATALRLDPDSAEAHSVRGFIAAFMDFDRATAEAEHQRAAQLAPNDPRVLHELGNQLAGIGRLEEAIATMRRPSSSIRSRIARTTTSRAC